MPSKRLSRQPSLHSIDLGNQCLDEKKLDSTKSGLLSNDSGFQDHDEARGGLALDDGKKEKPAELSKSDVRAIALLVVLCECLDQPRLFFPFD